jgi:hypothetical protein
LSAKKEFLKTVDMSPLFTYSHGLSKNAWREKRKKEKKVPMRHVCALC